MDDETCMKAIDISETELPKKIFTIWNGEYSDKDVKYFCYTENEARKICATLNDRAIENSDCPDYYYEENDIYTGKTVNKACYPFEITFDAQSHQILDNRKLTKLVSARNSIEIKPVYESYKYHCVHCGRSLISYDFLAGKCSLCRHDISLAGIKPVNYTVKLYMSDDAKPVQILKIAQDALAKYLAEKEGL